MDPDRAPPIHTAPGSPARAGMDPSVVDPHRVAYRLPRSRGDGPDGLVAVHADVSILAFAHPSANSKLGQRLRSAMLLIWRRQSEWVPNGPSEQPWRKPDVR